MKSDQIFKDFYKKVKKNGERYKKDFQKIKGKVDKSSAIYNGEPVDFIYQPVFFTEEEIKKLKEITNQLIIILKSVIRQYRENKKFRSYFNFPELMEELILIDPGYDCEFPMARFDMFFAEDNCGFCELNADGASGMNEARVIQNCFADSRIISDMAEDYNFSTFELFYSWIEALGENYQEFTDKKLKNPGLAIVDFAGEGVESEFAEFKKRFNEKGYNTVICDPRNLVYRDNALYYQDLKIDIIYRRATSSRLVEEADQVGDLLQAYRDGAVCIVGGFVSQIIHNKIIFSILHDQEKVSFLNQKQKKFIEKYIPYTVVFDDNNKQLKEELLECKNEYILKPGDWFACHGVYAGADYTEDEWKEIIAEIKDEEYIAQEYFKVPRRKMLTIKDDDLYLEDYNQLTGVYLYNQKFQGIYCRAGRENIIGSLVESFTIPAFLTEKKEE